MVIVRECAGLANQLYTFAAAYSLSKELDENLAIDISMCKGMLNAFCLDLFDIPDCLKLDYYFGNKKSGTEDAESIHRELKEKCHILSQNNDDFDRYMGLRMADSLASDKEVYMMGYFFERAYHDKYWEEIRQLLKLREEYPEVKAFRRVIHGKVSVGVHIRRGDMLLADFAQEMDDEYYKGAITYLRQKYPDCVFCIFSDDVDYAHRLLGKDDAYSYVHFHGGVYADVMEFYCLSLCQHHIGSNSSTYSRLSGELSAKKGYMVWQDRNSLYQNMRLYLGKLKKREYYIYEMRQVHLPRIRYSALAKKYKTDIYGAEGVWSNDIEKIFDLEINEANAGNVLNKVCVIELHNERLCSLDHDRIVCIKIRAFFALKQHDRVIALCDKYYSMIREKDLEIRLFIEALKKEGYDKEAYLESFKVKNNDVSNIHFVIYTQNNTDPAGAIFGTTEVALAFHRMGYPVSLVLDKPQDLTAQLMKHHDKMTRSDFISYDIPWYRLDELYNSQQKDFDKLKSANVCIISDCDDVKSITNIFPLCKVVCWKGSENGIYSFKERVKPYRGMRISKDILDFVLKVHEKVA